MRYVIENLKAANITCRLADKNGEERQVTIPPAGMEFDDAAEWERVSKLQPVAGMIAAGHLRAVASPA